jgi:ADP-ribose pyrophosphatase YjhB (NUDIX family)
MESIIESKIIQSVSVSHHIQKHIIDLLKYRELARFRELRPPRIDTNLFTYHLNALVKSGLIEKTEHGYTLTNDGLSYVDHVSSEMKIIRTQPKIITMLLIQNSNGDILLYKRDKQPYINAWTLPYGKYRIDDKSLMAAAQREAKEKLGMAEQPMTHVGDCYIRVTSEGGILTATLAHIFKFNRDDIRTTETIQWARPHKLSEYRLAPAVEQIMTRTFFNDPFFFEEFEVEWT